MITILSQSSLKFYPRFSSVSEIVLSKNSLIGIRYASLTSNIERAARRSAAIETSREQRFGRRFNNSRSNNDRLNNDYKYSAPPPLKRKSTTTYERSRAPSWKDDEATKGTKGSGTYRPAHWEQRGHISSKRGKGSGNIPRRRGKRHEPVDEAPERVKANVAVPFSVPYTTPASEFIYGLSAVEAALRCTRRKLYILYIYQSVGEVLSPEKITLRKLALARQVQVKMAFANWDRLLDKMSAGRPHNGVILEASPLPQLPVTCLEPVSLPTDDHFNVSLKEQSLEQASVNGSSNRVSRVPRYEEAEQPRFPLVILLDGVLDPGNMGAIIRSAYYLGVDALVLTGRNSAPMTPVTIKASAGAAENMTILKAHNENDFIRRSRENGWRFYAADSPENITELAATTDTDDASTAASSGSTSLLTDAPTVLMLGSEGTGLLPRIKAQADGFISIPGARIRPELGINDAARVDSLNVSVAAALLMEMLMRVPLKVVNSISAPSSSSTPEVTGSTIPETPPRSFEFN